MRYVGNHSFAFLPELDYPVGADEWLVSTLDAGAVFSKAARSYPQDLAREPYRYVLWRRWDQTKRALVVIGLNPSTATHEVDDPTIRRCMGFARSWGFGGLVMINLFAFRATDPAKLRGVAPEPSGRHGSVGLRNDAHLRWWTREANGAGLVLAAWGTHGAFLQRGSSVARMLASKGVALHCLAVTKDGHPIHPLYQPASAQPVPYEVLA
jgi:hypothetical protein